LSLTIRDAFALPTREEITAQEFVVKLRTEDDEARDAKLVADYVFTPTVEKELPLILDAMRHVFERGEEMGRFVHGSFGSGKSHFMSLLAMLLQGREVAWAKPAPVIERARGHREWLSRANLLVVRLHMLTADEGAFDRMVYEATNRALEAAGKPAFEFLHVDGVLDEMRREAAQYGDAFWEQLRKGNVLASKAMFELMAGGEPRDREDLARAYLAFKGRDARSAGIDPNWAAGLQRLCTHVKAQGFGGVVFFVDELMLWLGERSEAEFKRAINQLNTTIDHTDGRRAVPLFVFVARQRKLKEFFPDMASDDALEEHLAHHSERFEQTTLQDVELRHICRQRVLQRRHPDAIEAALGTLVEAHKKTLPTLLQNADLDYLRDVYPFHPALIEMLIDISSLMQRERTALRLLYELLVIHYPDLPLGQFLPVGSAFAAIFPPEETPQGRKKLDDLQKIHQLYYQRFRPAMVEMRKPEEQGGIALDERQEKVLDQLVKTALLAEVSPRLKGTGGLTVERLVRLNDVDVEGHDDRGRMIAAHQALVELGRRATALQVVGSGKTATVTVVLQGANLEEYLDRARGAVSAHNVRLKTFLQILKEELGLTGARWDTNVSCTVDYDWRGTKRRGAIHIRNVREMSNAQFRPEEGELFRIVIDYPWDDPGYTVENDRQRAQQVRSREGRLATACWLPRHMTSHELDDLTDYAAAQHLCTPEGAELLTRLGESERRQVIDQAESRMAMMRSRIVESLTRVYREHGQIYALYGDFGDKPPDNVLANNPRRLAEALLDLRFPLHPSFGKSYGPAGLRALTEWLVEAANTTEQSAPFDESNTKALKELGLPLELLDLGQTRGRLRLDTRYLKAVTDLATAERVSWDPIDEKLWSEFGFEPAVRNLFLLYVARLHSFRILAGDGTPLSLTYDTKARSNLVLERARLLSVAEWSRARELGPALFAGLEPPSANRTVAGQDAYAEALRRCGRDARTALTTVHKEIAAILGDDDAASSSRLRVNREAHTRLGALARTQDSFSTLRELLDAWPDDASDEHRAVVRDASAWGSAVETIHRGSLSTLVDVPAEHELAADARTCVAALRALLRDDGEPLARKRIEEWNASAQELIRRIVRVVPPPPPRPRTPTPPPPPPKPDAFLLERTLDASDADALADFWKDARRKLQDSGRGEVRVRLMVEDVDPSAKG
jgi:hypothetical protein